LTISKKIGIEKIFDDFKKILACGGGGAFFQKKRVYAQVDTI